MQTILCMYEYLHRYGSSNAHSALEWDLCTGRVSAADNHRGGTPEETLFCILEARRASARGDKGSISPGVLKALGRVEPVIMWPP